MDCMLVKRIEPGVTLVPGLLSTTAYGRARKPLVDVVEAILQCWASTTRTVHGLTPVAVPALEMRVGLTGCYLGKHSELGNADNLSEERRCHWPKTSRAETAVSNLASMLESSQSDHLYTGRSPFPVSVGSLRVPPRWPETLRMLHSAGRRFSSPSRMLVFRSYLDLPLYGLGRVVPSTGHEFQRMQW